MEKKNIIWGIFKHLLIAFGIFVLCIIISWIGDNIANQNLCWRSRVPISPLDSGDYIDTSTTACFVADKIIYYSVSAALYLPLIYLFMRFISGIVSIFRRKL